MAKACPRLQYLHCELQTLHDRHSNGLAELTSLRALAIHAVPTPRLARSRVADFLSLQGCLTALTALTRLQVTNVRNNDEQFTLQRLSGLSQLRLLKLTADKEPFELSRNVLRALTALCGLQHLVVDVVAEPFSARPVDFRLPALTELQFAGHVCPTASQRPPKLDLLQAAALAEACPALRTISGCHMELWEALDGDPACLRSGLQALTSLHARGLLRRPFAHLPADFFAEVRAAQLGAEELRPLRHMHSLHVRELARADVAWLVALAPHLEHLEASPDALPVLAPVVRARLRSIELVPWHHGHFSAAHNIVESLTQLAQAGLPAHGLTVHVARDMVSLQELRAAAAARRPYGVQVWRR